MSGHASAAPTVIAALFTIHRPAEGRSSVCARGRRDCRR
jgi:hypothetical protein